MSQRLQYNLMLGMIYSNTLHVRECQCVVTPDIKGQCKMNESLCRNGLSSTKGSMFICFHSVLTIHFSQDPGPIMKLSESYCHLFSAVFGTSLLHSTGTWQPDHPTEAPKLHIWSHPIPGPTWNISLFL